ncbi:PaaI family thioesterase [Oleispirillum naphthae]|uniref:PaaI family thioesterase n=1 Tax=Oleispirillum naphthae TaxID=2838853 RepID=UPI0030823E0B
MSGEEARNDYCFACGKANPIGLKLKFCERGGRYVSIFTPGPEHQSYEGALHGGIIGTVLDEVMGRVHCKHGLKVVTARMETRYRHPTPVGQALTVSGWVVKERGKLIEMAGSIALPDGTVTAEARASLLVIGTIDPAEFQDDCPACG